ncbi:MAG: 16S rRNA (uracil(1498)-N(3))-methyltransferase [Leucothrix sp.]
MRIPRYFINQPLDVNQHLALPDTLHRHAIQVLRGKVGDPMILFNGQGGEYKATLTEVDKRKSSVLIGSFDNIERESSLDTRLVLALIKSDKFDFALQKAVEMGVSSIQPVIAARSVLNLKASRLEKKMQHWQGVITSACEQSGRTRIPELLPIVSFGEYLLAPDDRMNLAMLPEATQYLSELARPVQPIALLVGPEGGFHDDEVALMQAHQVQTVKFGPRILRAETAVVAGLALCQSHWGDLSLGN